MVGKLYLRDSHAVNNAFGQNPLLTLNNVRLEPFIFFRLVDLKIAVQDGKL